MLCGLPVEDEIASSKQVNVWIESVRDRACLGTWASRWIESCRDICEALSNKSIMPQPIMHGRLNVVYHVCSMLVMNAALAQSIWLMISDAEIGGLLAKCCKWLLEQISGTYQRVGCLQCELRLLLLLLLGS